ncbi:MAG: peptidoglycan-binding protein [Patescibacteria group bacterium]
MPVRNPSSTRDYTITSPNSGPKTIYVRFYTEYGYSSQTYEQKVNVTNTPNNQNNTSLINGSTSTTSQTPVTGNTPSTISSSDRQTIQSLINTLKPNTRDPKVKTLQTLLKKYSYFTFPYTTTYYGTYTQRAVKRFLGNK